MNTRSLPFHGTNSCPQIKLIKLIYNYDTLDNYDTLEIVQGIYCNFTIF